MDIFCGLARRKVVTSKIIQVLWQFLIDLLVMLCILRRVICTGTIWRKMLTLRAFFKHFWPYSETRDDGLKSVEEMPWKLEHTAGISKQLVLLTWSKSKAPGKLRVLFVHSGALLATHHLEVSLWLGKNFDRRSFWSRAPVGRPSMRRYKGCWFVCMASCWMTFQKTDLKTPEDVQSLAA